MGSKNPSQKRYPPEMRERAVRMVETTIAETGERWGVVARVARQLGIGEETLRNWVKEADVDAGRRQGTTADDRTRIAELERENRELKRANAILRSASALRKPGHTTWQRSPTEKPGACTPNDELLCAADQYSRFP